MKAIKTFWALGYMVWEQGSFSVDRTDAPDVRELLGAATHYRETATVLCRQCGNPVAGFLDLGVGECNTRGVVETAPQSTGSVLALSQPIRDIGARLVDRHESFASFSWDHVPGKPLREHDRREWSRSSLWFISVAAPSASIWCSREGHAADFVPAETRHRRVVRL